MKTLFAAIVALSLVGCAHKPVPTLAFSGNQECADVSEEIQGPGPRLPVKVTVCIEEYKLKTGCQIVDVITSEGGAPRAGEGFLFAFVCEEPTPVETTKAPAKPAGDRNMDGPNIRIQ